MGFTDCTFTVICLLRAKRSISTIVRFETVSSDAVFKYECFIFENLS